ncbi:sporulation protein [Enterovibrio sp. Hal110]
MFGSKPALIFPCGEKDPSTKTPLTIKPSLHVNAVFDVLEAHGLRIEKADCEQDERNPRSFEQVFLWMPVSGAYEGIWRKLDVVVTHKDNALDIGMTVHRQGEGLGDMVGRLVGANKLERSLDVSLDDSVEHVQDALNNVLQKDNVNLSVQVYAELCHTRFVSDLEG